MSKIWQLTKQIKQELDRINKSGAGPYNKQYLKDLVCEYIDDLYK